MPTREVPEAVLIEILIRLPVKSLCRFRSVCTSWLSLICDPYFIRSHYALSETRPKVLLQMDYGLRSLWELHVSDEDPREPPAATVNLLNRSTTMDYRPSQSVHGLVCLSQRRGGIVIMNPITQERISISPPQFPRLSYCSDSKFYCFGFDPIADQHKVLCLSASFSCFTQLPKVKKHWVFTLGSAKEWRWIQELNNNIFLPNCDVGEVCINHLGEVCINCVGEVCINGVIYFQSFNEELAALLVAFDFKSESFQTVKLSLPGTRELYSYKLIEFNGSLALAGNCRPDGIDLLVLEDFHKQNWKLERSASPPHWWFDFLNNHEIKFACAPHSGNLLVFTESRAFSRFTLYFYDVRSNRFWSSSLERDEYVWNNSAMLCDHVESLLPLKGSSNAL